MFSIRFLIFLIAATLLASCDDDSALDAAGLPPGLSEEARPSTPEIVPAVEVLMINGGGNRAINYQSHLLHLKQMNKLLDPVY
jgi:hypothetical protein